MKSFRAFALTSTAILSCQHALAAGDAVAGKTVFENQCSICHTTVVGRNGFGPSLEGVFGRHSGGLPDYKYSTAMANAGLVWDAPTLDARRPKRCQARRCP
jgi:cytochrome c